MAPQAAKRNSGHAPRFRDIGNVLSEEIASGTLPLGRRLPTEQELCVRFGASRHAVREALRVLQEQGLVQRRQGAGTTVIAKTPTDRFFNSVSTLDGLIQYANSTRLEVLAIETLLLNDAQAAQIGTRPQEIWTRVSALRQRDGEAGPLCYSEIFLPAEFADIAHDVGRSSVAIYSLLEQRHRIRIVEVTQVVEAVAADSNTASRLGLSAGDPVLLISRHYADQSGRTVEVSRNAHPAGQFSYRMVLQRD